jgi:hypothetical protein
MTSRLALFTPSIATGKCPREQRVFPPSPPLAEDMLALNARQVMLVSLVLLTCVICF